MPVTPKAPKTALNLRLDSDLIVRLKRHALAVGWSASDLVAELVRDHLDAVETQDHGDGPRRSA